MSSLKQLIYNTLYEIATPAEGVEEKNYATAEEARDEFIAKVMAKLFPEESAVVTLPMAPAKAAKKEKTPKKSPEDKAAAKEAKEAEKAAKAAEKETAKAAKAAEKEAAKAAKAAAKAEKPAKSPKKSPEEKAAAKAAAKVAKATPEWAAGALTAPEEKPKKSPKKSPAAAVPLPASPAAAAAEPAKPVKQRAKPGPKPKPIIEGANIQKIDPTWRKHLKAAAKTAGKEHSKEMEAELLTFLNGMDKAAFDGAKAEEHVRAFLTPSTGSNAAAALHTPPRAAEPEDVDAIEVEFKGKTYFVDPASRRVYEQDGEVSRGVGYVGMAAFADMEMPETE